MDYTGQRYGCWTAIRRLDEKRGNNYLWLIRASCCGAERKDVPSKLRTNILRGQGNYSACRNCYTERLKQDPVCVSCGGPTAHQRKCRSWCNTCRKRAERNGKCVWHGGALYADGHCPKCDDKRRCVVCGRIPISPHATVTCGRRECKERRKKRTR